MLESPGMGLERRGEARVYAPVSQPLRCTTINSTHFSFRSTPVWKRHFKLTSTVVPRRSRSRVG